MAKTTPPDRGLFRIQTAHIFEALAAAETIQERYNALHVASVAFDHNDTEAYDASADGIALLTRCLQRDYRQSRINNAAIALYIRLICLFFRCSDKKAAAVFYHVGADLISLLVILLYDHQNEPDIACLIRGLVNRIAQLKLSLPAIDKKELLVRLMQRIVRGEYELRQLQLVAMQLASGWAAHPDSKHYLMNIPGLVEDILDAALLPSHESLSERTDTDAVLMYTANFFCQLCWDGPTKSELIRKRGFLPAILLLLNFSVVARCSETLRAVIDMLGRICTEADCRLSICMHDNGAILRACLNIYVIDDPQLNDAVNRTVLRLIRQNSAPFFLTKNTNIIERLTISAQTSNECLGGKDSSVLAAHALKRLASYITVHHKAHPDLLLALNSLTTTQNSRIRFWAVKGLYEQSKSSSGRFFMARTSDVLRVLTLLAISDPNESVKLTATAALLALASDPANARRLAGCSAILEAFVENAKHIEKCRTSSRLAIQAILSLASHMTANKQRIAKTLGLVESLSIYGVSQDTDNELKRAALHGVIILAPLM